MVTTSSSVRDNPARSRYELVVDGEVIGVAHYRHEDGTTVMPHTRIDPAHRGRGWGEVLVRTALDDLRAEGRRVAPQCWFVAEFMELHPEYADLRTA